MLFNNINKINTVIHSKEENELKEELKKKTDSESIRLNRFLQLPDLTRDSGGVMHELVSRVLTINELSNFDQIEVPEIVGFNESFDLFNFASDHPARSRSDTYFVDNDHILRTHTTIMWYYYLGLEEVKEKIKNKSPLGVISYGKVYRKDEIDRFHLNTFHQMDGLFLCPKSEKELTIKDLELILGKIAKAIFGEKVQYRFNKDTFPYTDPSVEMEIEKDGKWLEVLGGGMARPSVLKKLGLDIHDYEGWAFGFGLERLAMISMELPDIRLLRSKDSRVKKQLVLGNKFKEVSKYPPITRDISFVVGNKFVPNHYYDLIRDIGGDLVEEVRLLDTYIDEKKFGNGKISYTFRIIYRSNERTLLSEEVDTLQMQIYTETVNQFHAEVR